MLILSSWKLIIVTGQDRGMRSLNSHDVAWAFRIIQALQCVNWTRLHGSGFRVFDKCTRSIASQMVFTSRYSTFLRILSLNPHYLCTLINRAQSDWELTIQLTFSSFGGIWDGFDQSFKRVILKRLSMNWHLVKLFLLSWLITKPTADDNILNFTHRFIISPSS